MMNWIIPQGRRAGFAGWPKGQLGHVNIFTIARHSQHKIKITSKTKLTTIMILAIEDLGGARSKRRR
jgi:hypothetical protein